jgi:Na+-driven multidrug efflux pump
LRVPEKLKSVSLVGAAEGCDLLILLLLLLLLLLLILILLLLLLLPLPLLSRIGNPEDQDQKIAAFGSSYAGPIIQPSPADSFVIFPSSA